MSPGMIISGCSIPPAGKGSIAGNPYLNKNKGNILSELEVVSSLMAPSIRSQIYKKIDDSVGILSLTTKYDNLLMWSHYANDHRGMVIGFDEKHPFFNQTTTEDDELRHLRKVSYSKKRSNLSLNNLDGLAGYMVKSLEWEYEQEWRMLMPLVDADKVEYIGNQSVYLFKILFSAIKTVYIGARSGGAYKEDVNNILSANPKLFHVELVALKTDDKEFSLIPEAVD